MSGSISIFCRLKPTDPGEQEVRFGCRCTGLGDVVMLRESEKADIKREFLVDKLFPPTTSESTLFNHVGKPMVEHAMAGFDACCIAYGQTGAGKTYTTFGMDGRSGLLRGICGRLFEAISLNRLTRTAKVVLNVVEIYLNNIRDLLSPTDVSTPAEQAPPKDENAPIVSKEVGNANELMNVLGTALDSRTMAETKSNPTSSRSHTIVTLHISQTDLERGNMISSTLCIVDLAGSESDIGETNPLRMREAAAINRSLSALSNVLWCISAGKEHIPYRDSLLTRLLRPSLRIDSAVLMLCCVQSSVRCLPESLSTLQFAHRCRVARSQPRIAVGEKDDGGSGLKTLDSLASELMGLKKELHQVQEQRHELALIQAQKQSLETRRDNDIQQLEAEEGDTEEILLRKLSCAVERNNGLRAKLKVKTESLKEYSRKMNAEVELRKIALAKEGEKAAKLTAEIRKERENAARMLNRETKAHTDRLEETIKDTQNLLETLYQETARDDEPRPPGVPILRIPQSTPFAPPQLDTAHEQQMFETERRQLEKELAGLRWTLATLAQIGGVTPEGAPKELRKVLENALIGTDTRAALLKASTLGKSLLKK